MFVEAVLWIARTGSPWRDLPSEFGLWNSVYQRFARCSRQGVWDRMFAELARDADFEEVFIDSTIVRAHQHAAGASKKTVTKPLGEAGDSPQALPLLQGLQLGALCADKAYDTDAIIEHLTAEGIEAVIPPRRNRRVQRPFDKHRYKSRNLVERFASFVALVASVIWLA